MEIRHLKLVKEVAETKSLTKAKDALFLSQSALSHQLKELESELGTQLFHRVNKKLILTSAGKMVLESAEKILNELDKTQLSIKKYVSGHGGNLRLVTQCYTCYHWLPSIMTAFKQEFPNVEIEIFHNTSLTVEDEILSGKIDLAIVYQPSDKPNIEYKELFKDELFALVPSDHPWASKPYVEAKDFEDQNVIIHSYPLESVSLFSQVLFPENVKPKNIMQVQVTEAIIEMVKANMAVNVMASWIVEPYLEKYDIALVPVTKYGMHRTWHAAMLKENTPQYIENFVGHLKSNIDDLYQLR